MPWHAVHARDHIEVRFDDLAKLAGGSFYARIGPKAVIVLAPGLGFADERCALAHELVHDEIGVVSPPATPATMQRIEAMTRRRTAEWLVPLAELADLVQVLAEVEPVTAELVADEYEVTIDVAREALERLAASAAMAEPA